MNRSLCARAGLLTLFLAAIATSSTPSCGGNDAVETSSNGVGGMGHTGGAGGSTGSGTGGGQVVDPHVSGEYKLYHPLTFTFDGPSGDEAASAPNPFVDFRLQVHLTAPSGATWEVPGYFDGAGDGGGTGNVWRARFTPDEMGAWSYQVSFRAGVEVAVSLDANDGAPEAPDGTSGTFDIAATDKQAPDFRATGRLVYADDHYLRTQAGAVWVKGGADSPENFLGYAGFDNTIDQPGGAGTAGLVDGLHRYEPHIIDWNAGDPDWNGGAGKGIIGALNYLASQEVNSIYFLPCNLEGDGRETYPYLEPEDQLHLDVSKLAQWELVFAHAQTLGIALHVVLAETEDGNENLHDDGQLGVERKLYYRELAARFAHHPGLFWNIGEENDYGAQRQIEFATYLRAVDPYDHPTTVHTHANNPAGQYTALLGDASFELTSIQLSPDNADDYTETWRTQSAAAGRPWVVMLDEIGPAGTGVDDTNAAQIRQQTLWPAYLSGSGGVEWYFGYHALPLGGDMRVEDFRTREPMWVFTRHARHFIEALPLPGMQPDDGLLGINDGQVLFAAGAVYAIYLPNGGQTTLDLSGESGAWTLRWFDVTAGTFSAPTTLTAGSVVDLGAPAFQGDVAALLEKM